MRVTYDLLIKRRAQKEIARLPWQEQDRIEAAIDNLTDDPRPRGCQQVKEAEGGTYRLRVGDYRIIYLVIDDDQMIIVVRVARRREDTYKRR